jgi:hypothetical protein
VRFALVADEDAEPKMESCRSDLRVVRRDQLAAAP